MTLSYKHWFQQRISNFDRIFVVRFKGYEAKKLKEIRTCTGIIRCILYSVNVMVCDYGDY